MNESKTVARLYFVRTLWPDEIPNSQTSMNNNRVKESGKLLVNGHRAPWTKRGARRVGELEWRQREVREKERGAHNKEGQSVSGERPRSGKSHSPGGGVSQETSLVVMGTRVPQKLSPAAVLKPEAARLECARHCYLLVAPYSYRN